MSQHAGKDGSVLVPWRKAQRVKPQRIRQQNRRAKKTLLGQRQMKAIVRAPKVRVDERK